MIPANDVSARTGAAAGAGERGCVGGGGGRGQHEAEQQDEDSHDKPSRVAAVARAVPPAPRDAARAGAALPR